VLQEAEAAVKLSNADSQEEKNTESVCLRNATESRDQSTNFEQMNNSDEIKGSVIITGQYFDVISLLDTYVRLSSMSNENKMVNFNFL